MKKNQIKSRFVAFLCSFLMLFSGFTTVAMADTNGNSSSIICIDTPANNSTTSNNNLTVSGWSLNKSGVKEVQISIDNGAATSAAAGLSRPDVDKTYPGYTGGVNSGYSANLDISSLSTGAHTITVNSIGNDGTSKTQSVTIYKVAAGGKNMPQAICIDTPQNGTTVKSGGTLTVSGWSLSGYGVQKVQVFIDDANATAATLGISRPDVDKAYPGYVGGSTSGYTANIKIPALSDGTHTLKVVSTGNDGKQAVGTVSIKEVSEQSMPGRVCVDTPSNNSVINSNTLTVSGWALNVTGVKQVQVSVDNGTATNTVPGISRPDVDKVYPGYTGGAKSGYSTSLDVSSLSTGAHTLTVKSIGNDGAITTQNVTISRVPNGGKNMPQSVCIDTPKNGTTVKSGDALTVSGWSLSGYGVQKVQVFIDDANATDATTGISRPDVDKVYPGYLGGKTSGYTANVKIPALSDGTHTLKVVSTGNDGKQAVSTVSIKEVSEQSMPGKICVDTPSNNSVINSNTLTVSGWSLNVTGVKEVQVAIDNGTAVNAPAGLSRPDVNTVYPGYTGGAKSGYSTSLDVSSLSVGSHTLTVKSIGNDGVVTTQNVSINRVPNGGKNMPQAVCIDTPKSGVAVKSGDTLTVSGWSLNGYGVQKVQVYIDDANATDAAIGEPRSDVDKSFPGYLGGSTSGYTANVQIPALSDGTHTLKVVSTGNDGKQAVETVNIKKVSEQNMPGQVCIDTPNYSQVNSKQITVSGWSLDINGVKSVQVSADNGTAVNATTGISRTDVDNTFSNAYPNAYSGASNSGYSTTFDISKLAVGIHTINVVSTGKDGTTAKNSTEIYVLPAGTSDLPSRLCVDTPSNGDTVQNCIEVKGWSLYAFGVKNVQMFIDGNYVINAQLGLSRTDVDKVYPGYTNGVNSGFISDVGTASLSYGIHLLTVKSVGNDGNVVEDNIEFYKGSNTGWASKIVSFVSNQSNLNYAEQQAVNLHGGEYENNCVYFSSSVLRDLGIGVPWGMANTEHYVPYIQSLGWQQDYNINNLYPGNICFTVSDGTAYPTHTFMFMGWVNPNDRTLAYVADNQNNTIHIRSMIDAPGIDAFHFAFHN
ncbi:MAG: Ig-like domain-containing protein [Clostridium sp.]|nr:Ig-like domain-containing protein [Clostridium sp.]